MSRFMDAAGNEVKAVKGAMFKVAPENILVDWDENGRKTKPDLKDLENSIRTYGQLQPVIARRLPDGQLKLIAGYCRVEAIKNLNAELEEADKLTVSVVTSVTDDEGSFIRNIQENMARNATTPMDDAFNVARLRNEFGKDAKQVAQALGKTEQWVRKTEKLLDLDDKTKSLLVKGVLGWASGVMLADLAPDVRKQAVKELDEESQREYEAAKERVLKAAETKAEKSQKKAGKKTSGKVVDVVPDDAKPTTSQAETKQVPADAKATAATTETKQVPADVKLPQRRIESKKVAKKVREAGSKSSMSAPNRTEIRQFFENMTGPGEVALTRDLADVVLAFMAGKISDQAAEKKFRKMTSGTE